MNKPVVQINFKHVNQKVADAFSFLANSLGVQIEIVPVNPPVETTPEVKETPVEEAK